MFIGVYLCSSGLVLGLTLVIFTAVTQSGANWGQIRRHLARFTLLAAGVILFSLALFISLSAITGILPVAGVGSSSSLPQDYIEYGFIGWLILAIGVAGIFSPAITAVWLHQQHKLL